MIGRINSRTTQSLNQEKKNSLCSSRSMSTAATTRQHLMMMYILYHVFLFFMPSLATLLFSILVALLPIEKSIMILISPLYVCSLRSSVDIKCTYLCAFSCFIHFYFCDNLLFPKSVVETNRLVYIHSACVCMFARFHTVHMIA